MAKAAAEPEEPTADEAADPGKRIDQLEARIEGQESKLDQILGMLSGGSKPDAPAGEAPPADIASEIREQLAKRDREEAAKRAEAERDGTLASLQAKVAELSEQPPAPMPRRVERIMWGSQ